MSGVNREKSMDVLRFLNENCTFQEQRNVGQKDRQRFDSP